jgi:hypothetical protein
MAAKEWTPVELSLGIHYKYYITCLNAPKMFSFDGTHVAITGASGGVGVVTARVFLGQSDD